MKMNKSKSRINLRDPLDSVMYSYTTNAHELEAENKLLKETISQIQNELKRFKDPALMVCDVCDLIEKNAIVKTPNGNKFLVNISNECDELSPGDTVLCEQKNLTIIQKINSDKKFNVEQFVIMERCWWT